MARTSCTIFAFGASAVLSAVCCLSGCATSDVTQRGAKAELPQADHLFVSIEPNTLRQDVSDIDLYWVGVTVITNDAVDGSALARLLRTMFESRPFEYLRLTTLDGDQVTYRSLLSVATARTNFSMGASFPPYVAIPKQPYAVRELHGAQVLTLEVGIYCDWFAEHDPPRLVLCETAIDERLTRYPIYANLQFTSGIDILRGRRWLLVPSAGN